MKKISVIIPTYNRSFLLSVTLNSLRAQNIPKEDFEVIIADDGSSDNTKDILEEYYRWLDIKYLYQEDKGFRVAKARNMGIASINSELCIFVDSGIYLDQNCLAEHIRLHSEEKWDVLIGNVYGFSSKQDYRFSLREKIRSTGIVATLKECVSSASYIDTRIAHYDKYGGNISHLPAPWVFFWTCHVSVTAEMLKKVNGFDEMFTSWGAEDLELGYRLFCAGASFHFAQNARSLHYPHDHDPSENKRSDKNNLEYFHRKHNNNITKLLTKVHIMEINDRLLSV
ncbi:MAG: glycosyltransferase [Ruminococcus sp.]|nr:glycosyltransferase [Ruminococcus sp.]